ncbi:NAD-P-binding protein [Stereum hirsutum FP-91666 SS1]|uniref:NAD-P-binding protein n=1 Tax=Stereum hirsutum (strain FP-91666) TaxID=721885 RepID=UPI000444A429|nr:NAD-P-binding protein [Stereum hirsutum FP-91666 SS1]EIM81101.1 NAD-P-binding protein [Stereum hirsutum FP-91666 SS1]
MKVIVTGASGVLGTAVYDAFTNAPASNEVLGLAYTRPKGSLKVIDLLDSEKLEELVKEFKPDWIVHCAAERKPDVAEKDPEGTKKLNISVPENLAKLSKKYGFTLIYISTDYVFDGTSPPYVPSARTNPLQLYGETKRDGEIAVLGIEGSKSVVLRVPVLYGPAPSNADSAINILLDVVQDQSGKTYKMDHYQTRYPTNVIDIANFLVRMSALPKRKTLPPIIHYSSPEPFTKYEICLIFAGILGVPHKHIIPQADEPAPGSTPRPRDTQLYVRETEDLGIEGGLGTTGFEEWWIEYLGKKQGASS